MTFRVVRTNQYNQDLGLIHSTNGNHLECPNEGSSIDHQLRQSGPRPDSRLLRQTALEVLTRSARSDSPRKTRPEQIPAKLAAAGGGARRAAAAALGEERWGG
ncbi:hypothetical protein F511_13411 [Dorcoceras hygrometricum]|uniref:Uncharacterized protein n=1 Tax=Dorcoceras hygrometricum TaxID=472368 RepID=A0A2Z7DEC1_9LAMI|nr:hypothetical protein F511_13411 [Dorcoceras hygrometricum]